MIRNVLAFAGLAFIVAACGNKPSLGLGDPDGGAGSGGTAGSAGSSGSSGSAGSSGSGGGTWDPCAGKPCGAECSACPPNDPGCAETAVLKYCDANGGCGQAFPVCGPPNQCQSNEDCPQPGAPCEPCPDGSWACPSTECIGGQCVFNGGSCQGQQCKEAADCPAIGAPCQLCSDGSVACPWTDCVNGVCVGGFPGCPGWDPCDGKACGEQCKQCPPNDPGCEETAVLKFCDQNGSCQPTYPTCGGNQCNAPGDCPVIGVCKLCPDGSCAMPDCVGGKCELVCAPPPNPQCNTANDCPQIEICKLCSDGSCAKTMCIAGMCELACI